MRRYLAGVTARLGARLLAGRGRAARLLPAETPSPPGEPQTALDVRAAAVVERLKREPVAWLQAYECDEPLEKLDDAWLKGESHWALFSAGHFFEITVVRGRVVERSRPSDDRGARFQVRSWRQLGGRPVRPGRIAHAESAKLAGGAGSPKGEEPDFVLVAIPESVRGEILRKTDTRSFPLLLERSRITVVGQMTTGMPVAQSSFGPVDRRQDAERWASESKALMALLSEVLTTGKPVLTVEHFRSIRFEDRD